MCEHRSKPKRRARSGVEAEFSDEYALLGELYNFARVIGVRVYGVTIAGNQVSIGREHQSKRTAQVPRVVKRDRSLSTGVIALPAPATAKIALSPVDAT